MYISVISTVYKTDIFIKTGVDISNKVYYGILVLINHVSCVYTHCTAYYLSLYQSADPLVHWIFVAGSKDIRFRSYIHKSTLLLHQRSGPSQKLLILVNNKVVKNFRISIILVYLYYIPVAYNFIFFIILQIHKYFIRN